MAVSSKYPPDIPENRKKESALMTESIKEQNSTMSMYDYMNSAHTQLPENAEALAVFEKETADASMPEDWQRASDKLKTLPSYKDSLFIQLLSAQALINVTAECLDFEKALETADSITQMPLYEKSVYLQEEYAMTLVNAAIFSRNKEDGETILKRILGVASYNTSHFIQANYASALNNILCTEESLDEKLRLSKLIPEIPSFGESGDIHMTYAESLRNIAYQTSLEKSVEEGIKIAEQIRSIPGFMELEDLRILYAGALIGIMEESRDEKLKESLFKQVSAIPGFDESEAIELEYALSLTGSAPPDISSEDVLKLLGRMESLPLFGKYESFRVEYVRCLSLYGYALTDEGDFTQEKWNSVMDGFETAIHSSLLSVYAKTDIVLIWLTLHKELIENGKDSLPDFLSFAEFLKRFSIWTKEMKETFSEEDYEMLCESIKSMEDELPEEEMKAIEKVL